MRTATASRARLALTASSGWLARRWYYTPDSHRAYSVRQISPGDRRLLAEFVLQLERSAGRSDRDHPTLDQAAVADLSGMVFDHVLTMDTSTAVGFAALEDAGGGDRIIGISACSPTAPDEATFTVAVATTHRREQVGHILLTTLVRHAKRVGLRRLAAHMNWSNRPMHLLAESLGFAVEPADGDRNLRRLRLELR
jgi:GNAT superfamily N-acetyltransferase